MNLKKKLLIFYFISTLITIYIFIPWCYADEIDSSDNCDFNSVEVAVTPNSIPHINSRAAIVLEKSTSAILFGKNENNIRKMASTTKIMTAIIVLEHTKNLSEVITISKKAANIGGSRLGLSTNATITVNDLLYGLLLCSGNDTAIALAEFVGGSVEGFATLMNQKAIDLGLQNTHFVTPHGLDNDNHYTTAYELALLTKYALENEMFSKIVATHSYSVTINGSPKNIHNTNELLGSLNGVYGVKTGFTNGANRCLVTSCKRGDLDIICIVLGADTKKFRTQDSVKLIEYTFSNFEMVDIDSIIKNNFSKWQSTYSDNFVITKGISDSVETYLEKFKYAKYPMEKSKINELNVKFNCSYTFEAPLLENTVLGTVTCLLENTEICKLNVYSLKLIPRKNIFVYLDDFLRNHSTYLNSLFDF